MSLFSVSNNSIVRVNENSIVKIPEDEALFYQEVLILKMLQGHKNFPKLISYNISSKKIVLKKYDMLDDPVRYKEKICKAVHHLHMKGIIHADLKHDNILLDKETDEPIIIDFGNSNFDTQNTFQWSGTIGYIPPQIYKNRESHSYDIWSLAQIFGLSVANRPSCRPDALQLISHDEKRTEEYNEHRPASLKRYQVDTRQYYKYEDTPVIQFTTQQKTNLFNFYNEFGAKKTLLAMSFCHLSYTNMKSLTQLMFGVTILEKVNKIEAPKFNVLRWMNKHGLKNHNQVLWAIMVGETLDVDEVKKFPTTRFNRSFIVPVDKAFYKCSVDNMKEVEILKLFLEQRLEDNPEVKDNYDFFCKMF